MPSAGWPPMSIEQGADPRRELAELTAALLEHLRYASASGASGLEAADRALWESRRGPEPTPGALPAVAAPERPEPPPRQQPVPRDAGRVSSGHPASSAPAPAPALAAAPPAPALSLSPEERQRRLALLAAEIKGCTACPLHAGRTQTVFARGSLASGLCFIGEGPGEDEDRQGFPFVGKAGQLLDRMIAAMGFSRDEVYVCNIVKCRPPNNRKPTPEEMSACSTHLQQQLELVQPKLIVALGTTAVQGLFGTSEGIMRLRGRWKLYRGSTLVMPTFHPAYLLRTPSAKRQVWQDLQEVLQKLGRPIPGKR